MAEIVVVGAGVGGLSAAIDLSSRGHDVSVYEAGPEAGGKLGRTLVDGVEADTGPSVLTMPETFDELFRSAGTSLADEVTLLRHDELFDLRWPDGAQLTVHFAPEATLDAVAKSFGRLAADEFERFLQYAAGIWEAAAPAFVMGDAPTFGSAIGMGLKNMGALRRIDPLRTMLQAIEQHVSEPHLRDLLARYATYNGSDPRRAPATLNCITHVELTLGCYGVAGGMYELARALERVALRGGVEIHYDSPIKAIHREGRRVTGVELADRRMRADAVVANADAAHVFADLIAEPNRAAPEPSMSGWTGLVRSPRRERLGHAVLFPNRYIDEFVDIFDRNTSPVEPTVYVCAQEQAHGREGFADDELLFVMANAPPTDGKRNANDGLRDRVLDRLRGSGLISVDATLVWERSPEGLAARFPGTRGAIYGGASNSTWAAFQRPANRVPKIQGLYLASGSAHPGGGLPLCALSGRAAARALASDLG